MRLLSLLALGATALAASHGRKGKADADGNTTFNGVKVPPLLEITPDNFEKQIHAFKHIVIKHYSPYCPHCIDYAPTYQTLHEYYFTSKAVGTDTSFTELYDFRFAMINCVAYFDLCSSLKVASYPSTIIYKDGTAVETIKGVKSLDVLTEAIEPYLEEAKPGTRPKELNLPEAGEQHTPDFNAAAAITSDTKIAEDKAAGSAKTQDPLKGTGAKDEAKDDVKKEETKTEDIKKDAPAKTEPEKVPEPTETFNPEGVSVALNQETFSSLVTTTQKPWLIKFYAPWCHHCQAMAPTWQQLGKEMQGKLNIGEVNCEVEKRLCKDAGVNSFPTINFIKGGERVEYEGLRGLGDFVQFATSAAEAAKPIRDVDAASLKAIEEKEDVVFVYFYDHATTSEDFMALDRLPLSLVGRATIVKTKDAKVAERFKITTFPRLLVDRQGRPTYYNPLTPREIRDVPALLEWMKTVWLPIVPELTIANSREIMNNKIVVLGIVDREKKEAFAAAKHELNSAANEWMDKQILAYQQERQELRDAKQLRIDEAKDRDDERAEEKAKEIRVEVKMRGKEVAFAWVDGVFWQRWIKTTYGLDVKTDGERVIINDEGRRRYWDTTVSGNNILLSRSSILETLSKVSIPSPEIAAKSTLSSFERFFFNIRMAFVDHPFTTMGFILCAVIGGIQWLRVRTRKTRGGHFARMDDSWSTKELMKEGLLGGGMSGNGKVD
ncbi:thioredoxin-like protein [Plectosphaerella plurivora]|uniref:Thioredoxin-like protein n=1 Tax=Plectosphaerella plurivora TaxID=936078 RepID=A0A9P8VJQ0_9PEZI|nr:thioredoxin-like protein [Plectosphaerella plurivora]